MSFTSYRLSKLRQPIAGPFDEALAAGLGSVEAAEVELLRTAVLSRLPTRCPDDALDAVGGWYGIERFEGEPNGTTVSGYRGRLCAAWATWKKAGAPQAVIDSLRAWGLVDVQVIRNEDFGAVYDYSMFVVVLGPDFGGLIAEQVWGGFNWGEETWGSTATAEQRDAIIRQILKWKAVHGVPVKVILDFGGGFIWGLSFWGDSDVWGDPAPCEWYLANIWGESMVWGESAWGTGRWFAPGFGF